MRDSGEEDGAGSSGFMPVNFLDVRGKRPEIYKDQTVNDPRDIPDTGTEGPCIHCGHLRAEVDGKGQCLLCVIHIFMR